MSDKKKNSQVGDDKNGAHGQPPQVAPAEKHLGATADEDIPQDDPALAGKGNALKQQHVGKNQQKRKD